MVDHDSTFEPRPLRYWAKTFPSGAGALDYHPVLFHGLDVAATASGLLDQRPATASRLSALSGLQPGVVRQLIPFLLALHDLGKLADGFQSLAPTLMEGLQGEVRLAPYDRYLWRHDSVGFMVLDDLLHDATDRLGGTFEGQVPPSALGAFGNSWLSAALGHHGVPPTVDLDKWRAQRRVQFPPRVALDLRHSVGELRRLFLPDGLDAGAFDCRSKPGHARASWLLTGLAVAADWIGSSRRWFPPVTEPLTPEAYYRSYALPRAAHALADLRLGAPHPATRVPFTTLWPGFTPTPLQALTDTLPLAAGPALFVIEEVTGGGKTEAAFTLAHRLLAAGRGEGLYVALPTMATANAMFDRLAGAHRRLFAQGTEPSLVLAHGRAHLRPLPFARAADGAGGTGEDAARAETRSWLSDDRRKALLADVGIGTIDQALLGVLTCRHQSLRLWGLAGKVLVVDEVHDADAYMLALLERLLEVHAAAGGSAILLSATLSSERRGALCRAFARGLAGEVLPEPPDDPAYPALVHFRSGGAAVHPIRARAETSRRIAVALLHERQEVDGLLRSALEAGGCACWIRNTVGDAVETWRLWRERLGPDRVSLFHARFTVADRERIERDVVARFGPLSCPEQRGGRLLIATQVVEQSLDLDFDTLVTDLAPADRLVQRAGRLRRHHRDVSGRRQERDERGEPVLQVFSPAPADDPSAQWIAAFLPGTAAVYPDHGRLWLGARWLVERGALVVPDDLRDLIEHVYGHDALDRIPGGLQESTLEALGEERAGASTAVWATIDYPAGYRPEGFSSTWRDDVSTPTRLGEESVVVRLARAVSGTAAPYHPEGPNPWALSEVRVRLSSLRGWTPREDEPHSAALLATMPDEGRFCRLAILHGSNGRWTTHGHTKRRLVYGSRIGLTWEEPTPANNPPRR